MLIFFQWSIHQEKGEFILPEMQHIPTGLNTLVKKEFALDEYGVSNIINEDVIEQVKPTPSVLNKLTEIESILSELDPPASQQESIIIKNKLIVTEPEHEGVTVEVFYT